jgi:hypothetical protein
MRRGEVVWGGVLVLLGVLFFLKAAGYLAGDVMSWFWPLLIIALGAWILIGRTGYGQRNSRVERISIPLQSATSASLAIHHGAGRIDLRSGADPGDFLTVISGAGTKHSERLSGNTLEVRVEAGPGLMPFVGQDGDAWEYPGEYRLNPETPTALSIESGASRLDLDLTDLSLSSLRCEAGASRLSMNLPSRAKDLKVSIEAGAARIELHVPSALALRLHSRSIGSTAVDDSRFPQVERGIYQSPNFDSAADRAYVTVEGGAMLLRVD